MFKIPDYNACYLPSLILSVLWNFTFNRRYTFRSDGNVKRAMLLVALYYVVFITLSRWWSTELVAVGVHDWLIEVINMLVNFVTEFCSRSLWSIAGRLTRTSWRRRSKRNAV